MIKFVRLQVCKLICCLSLLFETCMPSLEVCTSTFVCCSASYEDVGPHVTDFAINSPKEASQKICLLSFQFVLLIQLIFIVIM